MKNLHVQLPEIDKEKVILFQKEKLCLNEEFVKETLLIKYFLIGLKRRCDTFDKGNPSIDEQKFFIEQNKNGIFRKLNEHFVIAWQFLKDLPIKTYKDYQRYYQKELGALIFCDPFNKYVYEKPLGYPGDYIMMNYLYEDGYAGDSTFAKLIHRYSCSIPVARANINRKHYFKSKILDFIKNNKIARIASIACGPAKEIIELMKENLLPISCKITCFDSEILALEQIQKEVQEIESLQNTKYQIKYVYKNILQLLNGEKFRKFLDNQDLIYAAGLIDYLKDKTSKKIIFLLSSILNKNGIVIIGNVSANDPHRAYHETIGEWWLNYRTRQQLLTLTDGITDVSKIYVEDEPETSMNHFLILKK